MNRKQLTLLIVVGAVLGGLGWVAWQKEQAPYKESMQKMGGKVLPNFPLNDVEQIVVKQPKAALVLAKKDDIWVVRDRGDYPANFGTISDVLRKFWELKVAKPVKTGPSRLPMLDLVPPDKGAGTLVEFKDKSGKTINSVLLGAKSMKDSGGDSQFGGGSFPDGRYLMVGSLQQRRGEAGGLAEQGLVQGRKTQGDCGHVHQRDQQLEAYARIRNRRVEAGRREAG
jgi:hypothetical protein